MADMDFGKMTLQDFLGQSSEGFLKTLADAKLDETSSKFILGQYIQDKSGYALRTFALSAASSVAGQNPTCKSDFTPGFTHTNWTDGEDLVEAEGIKGFNIRFNSLRIDLDHIKADLTQAFACIAALQKAISGALTEITTELNAIDRQIYECCSKPDKVDPGFNFHLPPQEVPHIPYSPIPPVTGGFIDPRVIYPVNPYTNPAVDPTKVWRDASNPDKGIVQGQPADRIDVAAFNGKQMDVWKINTGLMLTESVGVQAGPKPNFVPNQLDQTREFSRFLAENDASIKASFPAGFTKKQFADKFGTTRLTGDMNVADALKSFPDDMAFADTMKLSDAVAEANAKAMVSTGLGQATVVGTIGLNAGVSTSDAPIGSVKFADEATVKALDKAGIKTLGQLANTDPAKVKAALDAGGINRSVGEAAGLRGMAQTVTRLGVAGR